MWLWLEGGQKGSGDSTRTQLFLAPGLLLKPYPFLSQKTPTYMRVLSLVRVKKKTKKNSEVFSYYIVHRERKTFYSY